MLLYNKPSWEPDLVLFCTASENHLVPVAYLVTLAPGSQIIMQLWQIF